MVLHRLSPFLLALLASACATTGGPGAGLDLSDSDDAMAAAAIRGLLDRQGVPVESGSDGESLLVYRRGMATRLEPVMQPEGLDRVVSTRRYAPAPGRSERDLDALARSLNESLNVGVFSVEGGALVFQSQVTFVDRLGGAEMLAFLDWLDTAELAIARVDGEAGVLLLSGA
jgi:hypothetical protein